MKKQFFSFLTLFFIVAALFAGCGAVITENETQTQAPALPSYAADGTYDLGEGLFITGLFAYSGVYPEDGGDATCEGIAALRLENRSDVHYEYLTVTVDTAGGSYAFSVSTLFAGATVTVLDKNKTVCADTQIRAAAVGAKAAFLQPPTVHLDTLSISYTDGFITVKNLTDRTLSDVYVYYKSVDENGYFGGITYRAAIGELAAGAAMQTPAPHIKKDGSRVVFAEYDS